MDVMHHPWLDYKLGLITNNFVTLIQGEVDRFQDTIQLLADYYKGMECKVLDDITEAAEETIPKPNHKPGDKKQKGMAGWKDYVEPYQDRAQFWFSIWSSAGKPINTVLHNIMKKTRNQYHYQIRKCKRVEDFIKNKKLVENCLDGDNDLFE